MIRLFLNVCKTFQKIKHSNFNDYERYRFLSNDPSTEALSCPSCKAPAERFTRNGSYKRHFVFIHNGHIQDILVDVRNLKCTSCKKSHALLYSLIIPYCPYSVSFLVELIYKRLTGHFTNIPQLCEFYDISERTFYRIWKRLLMDARRMSALLDTFGNLLNTVSILSGSQKLLFHSILNDFFASCGYSFLQPCITFRQRVTARGIPPDVIK